MNAVTETLVRAALLDCYDLDLPCNIVDLGLVLEVSVRDDPDAPGAGIAGVPTGCCVSVVVIPAQATDQSEAHLRAQISNRVAGMEGVSSVAVDLRPVPAWDPGRISVRGRRALGLTGNPSLVQIASR